MHHLIGVSQNTLLLLYALLAVIALIVLIARFKLNPFIVLILVSLAPGLAAAQRALADLAVQREDWPTAVSALEAVLAWEPEDVPAAVALTSVLVRQHECAGATALVQRIARVDSRRVGSDRELLAELKRCGF